MAWQESYRVNVNDADRNRIASAGSLTRYLLDAADSQMEGEGPAYLDLFDRGYAFVLCRVRYRFTSPVHIHDRLTAETWAIPGVGVSFGRGFRLLRDGVSVAEGDSVWALVDHRTGTPVRGNAVELHYSTGDWPDLGDVPSRLRLPRELTFETVGEHRAAYAECDVNGHVNNTRYVDFLSDYLPLEGRRIATLLINYRSELPLGETVSVERAFLDGTWYFRTVKPGGAVNAEAAVTLSDL